MIIVEGWQFSSSEKTQFTVPVVPTKYCKHDQRLLTIKIKPDLFFYADTSFRLSKLDATTDLLQCGTEAFPSNQCSDSKVYMFTICLKINATYVFETFDVDGNGLCCSSKCGNQKTGSYGNGSYEGIIGDDTKFEGAIFEDKERSEFIVDS